MAHELLNVLKDIHTELIVSNFLTAEEKHTQRRIFELEQEYNMLDKWLQEIDIELEKFSAIHIAPGDELDEEEFEKLLKEKNPGLLSRRDRYNKRFDYIFNKLTSYKDEGYVVRAGI
jgi:hypothetical protein